MGFWFLATMIESYIASYIGSFIVLPQNGNVISKQQSLERYKAVFGYVAIGILVTTIIMVILTSIVIISIQIEYKLLMIIKQILTLHTILRTKKISFYSFYHIINLVNLF